MTNNNPWEDGFEPDLNELRARPEYPSCGGVRFEDDETKSSLNWEKAISTFFTIGGIAIVGHLIQMWWK